MLKMLTDLLLLPAKSTNQWFEAVKCSVWLTKRGSKRNRWKIGAESGFLAATREILFRVWRKNSCSVLGEQLSPDFVEVQ